MLSGYAIGGVCALIPPRRFNASKLQLSNSWFRKTGIPLVLFRQDFHPLQAPHKRPMEIVTTPQHISLRPHQCLTSSTMPYANHPLTVRFAAPPSPPLVLLTSHGVTGFNNAQDLQHHLALFHLCRCWNPLASMHLIMTHSISPLRHTSHQPSYLVLRFFAAQDPSTPIPIRKPAQVNCNIRSAASHHAETLHTRDQLPRPSIVVTASVYKLFKALPYCPIFKPTQCDPKRSSVVLFKPSSP